MTRKEKELLLKDLCARLPYGVKIDCGTKLQFYVLQCIFVDAEDGHVDIMNDYGLTYEIEDVKPYLRPMSSMTEEEVDEYNDLCACNTPFPGIVEERVAEFMDWLNAHHFDFRNFIEKGLALEAPKDMYKED